MSFKAFTENVSVAVDLCHDYSRLCDNGASVKPSTILSAALVAGIPWLDGLFTQSLYIRADFLCLPQIDAKSLYIYFNPVPAYVKLVII